MKKDSYIFKDSFSVVGNSEESVWVWIEEEGWLSLQPDLWMFCFHSKCFPFSCSLSLSSLQRWWSRFKYMKMVTSLHCLGPLWKYMATIRLWLQAPLTMRVLACSPSAIVWEPGSLSQLLSVVLLQILFLGVSTNCHVSFGWLLIEWTWVVGKPQATVALAQ